MAFARRRRRAAALADPGSVPGARAAAVTLLARRDFSTGELRSRLIEQGFDAPAAGEAVAELVDEHLVDDARYLTHFIAYHAARGEGPVRIRQLLRKTQVEPETIEAALQAGADWQALAREARIRRFGPAPPADWKAKVRQARFLQYRGFSSDHVRAALGGELPDEMVEGMVGTADE